ncbi:MAG: aromatic amino acid lyase, partial [Gammaproteobacteria bacterium]|nr:aromatic amino acid lyase [Gammaproteobacteria bacterium]
MTKATTSSLTLLPGHVSLASLRNIYAAPVQLSLDPSARALMQASLATVQRIVDEDQVVYGINTGFGKLASTKIAHERLAELQRNLVLSHSVGTGDALADDVVRLILATKAISLARGHSG